MASLRDLLRKSLLEDVLNHPKRPKRKKQKEDGSYEWAILVLDENSSRILQSCFSTHEITSQNIARFEFIKNKRDIADMHAIYFLTPTVMY